MKYNYPNYKLKMEFTPGTWGENDWELGEVACVDRAFYSLPYSWLSLMVDQLDDTE